ncbi:MAG: HNH endonuclease signature motif containing protein, partial [Actinomycetes bacterium]
LTTVVVDSLGNPVDLGRTTRLVPRTLRKALVARDGGCVFPGCDAPPPWCDAHHVVHWADGGATSAENLALLCRHHHGTTHRRRWTMDPDPRPGREQRFTWTRPDGRTIHSQRATDHTHATHTAPNNATTTGPPGPTRE